jgi:uncharacterized DUF497 family protein
MRAQGGPERPIRGPSRGRFRCDTVMVTKFTWNEGKAASNLAKHGVSFVEAATVFVDRLALFTEDEVDPGRAILLGMSEQQRLILVVHAEVTDSVIRIISARHATSHERRRYEEGP